MVMTVPIRAPLPVGEGRHDILMLSRRTGWVTRLVQAMLWVVVCSVATTGVVTHSTTREDTGLVQQRLVQLVVRP